MIPHQWMNEAINNATKVLLYQSLLQSIILCYSETRIFTNEEKHHASLVNASTEEHLWTNSERPRLNKVTVYREEYR